MRSFIRFTVMSAVALSSAASFSASALAVELPAFAPATGFTGTSGKTTVESIKGSKIVCKSSTTEATSTTTKEGAIHIVLEGCEEPALKVACTGLGDAPSGKILLLGKYRLVRIKAAEAGALLSLEEAHFSCTVTLVRIKGSALAVITPLSSKTNKYEFKLKQTKGKQEIVEYENDSGAKVGGNTLSIASNEGAFEEAGGESTESKLTTAQETEIRFVPTVTAPETDCALTSEGVTFVNVVTTSNETALREQVLNSTWIPAGESECKEVSEFKADVSAGKITAAQKEEYQKYITEHVVPGVYIYAFKWHISGGSTFEALGVTSSGGGVEFEPLGIWNIKSVTEKISPVEAEAEVLTATFTDEYVTFLFGFKAVTVEAKLRITTPDKKTITTHSTNLFFATHVVGASMAVEVVSEKVVTEAGGVQCYESKVRQKSTSSFGLFSTMKEDIPTLCANGVAEVR